MNTSRRVLTAWPAPNASAVGVHPLFIVSPASAQTRSAARAESIVATAAPGRAPASRRWRLVPRVGGNALVLALLGCVIFGGSIAPAADSPAAPAPESVIYPKNSPERPKVSTVKDDDFPVAGTVAVVLLLAAGAWMVFKRGSFSLKPTSPDGRRLAIEETRPLGNKQFLAVATYGDRKLLIAVCPGKIDLLCRLDEGAPVEKTGAELRSA